MQFKHGFIYMGVRYGWNKKQLYRLPFSRNLRNYDLKLIKPILIGSTTCYNLQRNKVTINRIEKLTTKVDWNIEFLDVADCPF